MLHLLCTLQVQKHLDDNEITGWRVVPDKPRAISRLLEDAMTPKRLQLRGRCLCMTLTATHCKCT